MKKIIAAMLVIVSLMSFAGCSRRSYGYGEKTFSEHGMSITLTSAFSNYEADGSHGYAMTYSSKDTFVMIQKEFFSLIESGASITDREYPDLWIEANESQRKFDAVESFSGFVATSYSSTVNDTSYTYFVAAYKGRDAFWTVQFACDKALYEELRPYFVRWASSVKFS